MGAMRRMARGSAFGVSAWGVALSLFLPFCKLALAADSVECGFGGFIKANYRFPLRVVSDRPVHGLRAEVVDPRHYENGRLTRRVVASFEARTGASSVICTMPSHHSQMTVECEWQDDLGRTHGASARYKLLDNASSRLVLVVSERPESFEFINAIRPEAHGDCRLAATSLTSLPENWMALDAVDLLIVDESASGTAATDKIAVLRAWVASGGSLVLTARALDSPLGAASSGLFGVASVTHPVRMTSAGESLSRLLPDFAEYFGQLPLLGLSVPNANRVLWSGDRTVIASQDIGRGNVAALALDWESVQIEERIAFESFRKALWGELIGPQRYASMYRRTLNQQIVTPKEAKAKYLVWYVVGFLVLVATVLGLGNWLVLRGGHRLEYSILTLPVGAVGFALLAFCVGLALRGDETIVDHFEVSQWQSAGPASSEGIVGVLAADRQPVSLVLNESDGWIRRQARHAYFGFAAPAQREAPIRYTFNPQVGLSDSEIGMWTMGFFRTERLGDFGGGLEATAEVQGTNLVVSVTSHLPFTLRDAHVIYRWHRAALGSLPPGASANVAMPLIAADALKQTACPNCGGFHGAGWFSKEFAEHYPLPEELRRAIEWGLQGAPSSSLFIAGWHQDVEDRITINRDLTIASTRELCTFPLALALGAGQGTFPMGVLEEKAMPHRGQRVATSVDGLRQQLQVLPWIYRDMGGGGPSEDTAREEMFAPGGEQERVVRFELPAPGRPVTSSAIDLRWTQSSHGEDHVKAPATLAAFNWSDGEWTDLHTSVTGTNTLSLTPPGEFVHAPTASLLVRIRKQGDDPMAFANLGSISVAWEFSGGPEGGRP